jgi:anti-anti-sigma regulatory factor
VLRITDRPAAKNRRVLLLEGKVCCQWLDELRTEIEKTLRQGKELTLDFDRVTFIDEDGASLIKQYLSKGIESVNGSLFIRTLLELEARGNH